MTGMRTRFSRWAAHAKRRVVGDLAADPYLRYILLLSVLLCSFYFWESIPNFVTQDEEDRLFDAMTMVGSQVQDPGLEGLRNGITQGRLYGSTVYTNLIALTPAIIYAALSGHLNEFGKFYKPDSPGYIWTYAVDQFYYWQGTPEWVWTSGLVLIRLISIAFAIGSVYLVYRIGTQMLDRTAGRLSALLLTLTWGVIQTAHEGGDDLPMLFFLLCVIYLSLRYIETGSKTRYYLGCVCAGLAGGFKLSGGLSVLVLGAALFLRARHSDSDWQDALLKPRFIATALLIGVITVLLAYPSIPLTGFEKIGQRLARQAAVKTSQLHRVNPIEWWLLRNYLNGFGLPLFITGVGGVLVGLPQLRKRTSESAGYALLLVGAGAYLAMYLRWPEVRVHHLLPTFPAVVLFVSIALTRLRRSRPNVGGVVIGVLVVSSALYAGVGTAGYAAQPRSEAVSWLEENAGANDTVEVYTLDIQDSPVPYGMNVSRRREGLRVNHSHLPDKTEWMLNMPERCPEYIVLTYNNHLYLAPPHWDRKAGYYSKLTLQQKYIYELRIKQSYNYEVAEEFGEKPVFFQSSVERRNEIFPMPELLRVGIIPRTRQYGDEQDTGPEQYTVVLQRKGVCSVSDFPST